MGWTVYDNLAAGTLLAHEVLAELQAAANERSAFAVGAARFPVEGSSIPSSGTITDAWNGVQATLDGIEGMVAFEGRNEGLAGHVVIDGGELYWLTIDSSPSARQKSLWPLALGAGATGWPARVHNGWYVPDAALFLAARSVIDCLDGYLLPPQATATISGGNVSDGTDTTPEDALAASYGGLTYAEPAPGGYGYFFGLGRWGLCTLFDAGPPQVWNVMWEYHDVWTFTLDTSGLADVTLAAAWLELGDLSATVGSVQETVTLGVWIGATKLGVIDTSAPDYTDGYPRWLLPISNLALVDQEGDTVVTVKLDPQSQMTTAPANWTVPADLESYVHGVHAMEVSLVATIEYDYREST